MVEAHVKPEDHHAYKLAINHALHTVKRYTYM